MKTLSRKVKSVYLSLAATALPLLVLAQDQSPINSAQDIINLAGRVSQWFSTIFWIVAGIMVLYGGFLYMTAAGNDEQVKKAHKQLLYAVIAIAVGILSAGLPGLVSSFLGGK